MDLHGTRECIFPSVRARATADRLEIRTVTDQKSLAVFLAVVAASLLTGLAKSGWLDEYPWVLAGIVAAVGLWLALFAAAAFVGQRLVIDRRAGVIEIVNRWLARDTVSYRGALADLRAVRVVRTGVESESTSVGGDSVGGFIAAQTLGIGWITTVTTTRLVAVYLLVLRTGDGREHGLLVNYDGAASDRALLAMQAFLRPAKSAAA